MLFLLRREVQNVVWQHDADRAMLFEFYETLEPLFTSSKCESMPVYIVEKTYHLDL